MFCYRDVHGSCNVNGEAVGSLAVGTLGSR